MSPSLAEVLRLCPLRAGLSRVDDAKGLVLGNPRAWLGIAYHDVLTTAAKRRGVTNLTELWDQAIRTVYERAQAHPLDQRFGAPDRWPGYHLVRAMALVRAQQVASERNPQTIGLSTPPKARRVLSGGHERWLTGAGGRLVGRPDLLCDDAVFDYKTGDVFEPGVGEVIRAPYIRQLRFYAFLAKESTGRWPTRGVLLPMEGPPVEIDLHPSDCERIATEALDLLDQYNDAISATDVAGLAKPSPEACRWCPFKLVCPPFWMAADSSWSDHPGTAALGGATSAAAIPIHMGAALALSVRVEQGTEPTETVQLAPLDPATHPILANTQSGTQVRIVGLAKRADGRVVPTSRTVIVRSDDVPKIVVGTNHGEV